MAKRKNTTVGDLFSVKIDDGHKKYFQYIISDLTQLNSDVIRTFKTVYAIDGHPDMSEIVQGEIDFYAHCVTIFGLTLGIWEKVGNVDNVGQIDHILFRSSEDLGNLKIKISENWWVWKINEKQTRVGKLEGENEKAEIGTIVNPYDIVDRMRIGKYNFVYPAYK